MPNQKYTELTNAVYNLLDFFPEDEPLKNKAKEKALAVLGNLVLAFLSTNTQKAEAASQALKDIEVLESYLYLGRKKRWVDNMNLMILLKEYDKIKEEIKPLVALSKKEEKSDKIISVDNSVNKEEKTVSRQKLSSRQEEILKVLEIQNKAQVADLKRVIPNVSKRTLRRDLDVLLKTGKIKRTGEWNQIFYQLSREHFPEVPGSVPGQLASE